MLLFSSYIYIHCLAASCWLWETTMVMLIGESDGWVKIAAVHHLRRLKWPFVDPCRVFCYKWTLSPSHLPPPLFFFFPHHVLLCAYLYFFFFPAVLLFLLGCQSFWFIPHDCNCDTIAGVIPLIRSLQQSLRMCYYQLSYYSYFFYPGAGKILN